MCTKTTKAELRKKILSFRSGLSVEERRQKSAAICERLFSLQAFHAAETVLFFVGFGSEVDTLSMLDTALQQGKRVLAPKVIKGRPDMELRQLSDPTQQLHPGTMGILEPDAACPLIPLEEIDLIIVPAVAWDEKGYRVGYGGGFYDRLLARAEDTPHIGLGFECQVVAEVPRTDHDLGVDILVTEDRVLKFN